MVIDEALKKYSIVLTLISLATLRVIHANQPQGPVTCSVIL